MRTLPDGWVWAQFKDVASVESNLVDPAGYPDMPHIAPNHIESRTGRLLDYTTVSADGVTSSKHLFKAGQILYSKIRPYLAKAVLIDFDGLCSADMYPISTRINVRFLHQWLISAEFTEYASQKQGRSVLPKINQRDLGLLPIPIPPLAEQERIIDAIDTQFSHLDAAEESLRAAARRLGLELVRATGSTGAGTLRQAILHRAFSGRLVQPDPSDESGSDLVERILRNTEGGTGRPRRRRHARTGTQ